MTVLPLALRRAAAALSLLSFATAAGAVMALATQSVLARQLGPAEYGLFASSLATVSMVAPLAGFGLSQFRMRAYGAEGWGADRWIRPSFRLGVVTTVVALALVHAWAAFIAPTRDTQVVLMVLSPVVVGVAAVELVSSKLRLEERYGALAACQLLVPSGRLAIALLAVAGAAVSAIPVALGYGLVAVAVVGLLAPQLRAMLRGKMGLRGHGARPAELPVTGPVPGAYELWSQALPYGLAAALYPVFFQVSTVMLKYLGSDAEAGIFGISMAVMAAIYLIPTTIYQKYLISKLHRWASHDRPKFWLVYRRGIVSMLALGTVVGAGLALLGPLVVRPVFGPAYVGVIGILPVLALCPPIRFLSTALGSVLLTSTHMYYRVLMMGLAAGVTITLDVLLIPRYQALGAAYAIVGGEVALVVTTWLGARRYGSEFR